MKILHFADETFADETFAEKWKHFEPIHKRWGCVSKIAKKTTDNDTENDGLLISI